jgi:DNA-binding transcriptional MerR regulator
MQPNEYSLEDLARHLSIQPRTIRSYIQQGLLRGPDSMGRNARYSGYHLKRLELIKALKDEHGLTLDEIRRQLTMTDEAQTQEALTESTLSMPMEAMQAAPPPMPALSEEEPNTALDFIRARRQSSKGTTRIPQRSTTRLPGNRASPSGPIEKLLEQLRGMTQGTTVPRKARGEEWVRLEITPDIEIHVRGQLSQEQLQGFEQLSDLMRHILLGSDDHDR